MVAGGEVELIDEALGLLGERLPPGWTVERAAGQGAGEGAGDALFVFSSQSGMGGGAALVEARPTFSAADVERLLGGLTRRLRETSGQRAILLVSEFLSPRTRSLLAQEDISYLDLTGNLRLVLQMPPIFVETSGADRRPSRPPRRAAPAIRGATAGRVVRLLAEVDPPYGVGDIEEATGISRGYISKILDRLSDEALITRRPRGPVERVDWPALLRARGQSVDLFAANTSRTYLAPNGARAALESVAGSGLAGDVVVTGSFAAVRVAPVAAPTLLVLYLVPDSGRPPSFATAASALGLLETDEAADVVLLAPPNSGPVEDPRPVDGLAMVSLPQLVVDCLGGTGRMPAEAEAVVSWMGEHGDQWRFASLADYLARRR